MESVEASCFCVIVFSNQLSLMGTPFFSHYSAYVYSWARMDFFLPSTYLSYSSAAP